MSLNHDILSQLLSYICYTEDLARMTRTCRALRTQGVVEILRRGVRIWRTTNLTSLLAFMDAEPERRPMLLRKFGINYRTSRADRKTGQIAELLSRCRNIETLCLSDATLLDVDDKIGAAFINLEHVKILQLTGCSYVQSLVPFLTSMRSKCTTVEIDYRDYLRYNADDNEDEESSRDPSHALSSFRSSLQYCKLVQPTFSLATVQYPHVETLSISNWDNPRLQPLVYTFPNVLRLIIEGTPEGFDFWRDMREENISSPQWTQLDYIRGDVASIHAFGLSCPVRRWDVQDGWESLYMGAESQVDELFTTLQAMPVTRLQLKISISEESPVRNFFDRLGSVHPQMLSHLSLSFDISMSSDCIHSVMTSLTESIRHLQLRYFDLSFSFETPDMLRDDVRRMRRVYEDLPYDAASVEQDPRMLLAHGMFDYLAHSRSNRQIAADLSAVSSTLQYIFVHADPTHDDNYWMSSREGDAMTMTELNVEDARKVMRDEDMQRVDFNAPDPFVF